MIKIKLISTSPNYNPYPVYNVIVKVCSGMNYCECYTAVRLYSLAETPQLPPAPAYGLVYEDAIGQPR